MGSKHCFFLGVVLLLGDIFYCLVKLKFDTNRFQFLFRVSAKFVTDTVVGQSAWNNFLEQSLELIREVVDHSFKMFS